MIIDDTGYLPLHPTKHTAQAKKHRSVRLGMVSYFNDIKTKSYIQLETNAKTIENTKFRTRKLGCQFHLKRAYFVQVYSYFTLHYGTD